MKNEKNMIYENAEYYFSLWQPRVLNNLDKYVVLRSQEVKQYYETDEYIKVIDLCIQNLDISYDLSPLRITEGKFEPYTFYYFLFRWNIIMRYSIIVTIKYTRYSIFS